MRAIKCLATLILSVALSNCAPKPSNSSVTPSYPVTLSFGLLEAPAYCQSLFPSVTLDFTDQGVVDSCINLYLTEVQVRLLTHYNLPSGVWNICIGNPGLCQDPTRMEDFARNYHQ